MASKKRDEYDWALLLGLLLLGGLGRGPLGGGPPSGGDSMIRPPPDVNTNPPRPFEPPTSGGGGSGGGQVGGGGTDVGNGKNTVPDPRLTGSGTPDKGKTLTTSGGGGLPPAFTMPDTSGRNNGGIYVPPSPFTNMGGPVTPQAFIAGGGLAGGSPYEQRRFDLLGGGFVDMGGMAVNSKGQGMTPGEQIKQVVPPMQVHTMVSNVPPRQGLTPAEMLLQGLVGGPLMIQPSQPRPQPTQGLVNITSNIMPPQPALARTTPDIQPQSQTNLFQQIYAGGLNIWSDITAFTKQALGGIMGIPLIGGPSTPVIRPTIEVGV